MAHLTLLTEVLGLKTEDQRPTTDDQRPTTGTGAILKNRDALHSAISLERNPRTSPCPVAQPVSSLASRDLLRRENAAKRLSGVLGVYLAGAHQPRAIPEMDCRN